MIGLIWSAAINWFIASKNAFEPAYIAVIERLLSMRSNIGSSGILKNTTFKGFAFGSDSFNILHLIEILQKLTIIVFRLQ